MDNDKRLFLLDAMALIYRAYFALARSPRITSTGKNTNAQFGFTNTLIDLIKKEKPSHLAVVFEGGAEVARTGVYTEYKANRQETPEDLRNSIPDIQRIIEGFNLPCVESAGYEADDTIATLAIKAASMGYTVYMVTPDKDYGQVVNDKIFIYKPAAFGNAPEVLDAQKVCERWGIKRVDQVIDILGLMGDAVDNIPGIKGVGEKTAAKLLEEYDTLEGVLENADKIKGALGEKVRNGVESAKMSKLLATIITDVPVEFHEENFSVGDFDKEKLTAIFSELEFKALGKRILGEEYNVYEKAQSNTSTDLFGNPIKQAPVKRISESEKEIEIEQEVTEMQPLATIENTKHDYFLVDTPEKRANLIAQLVQQSEISFDTETTDKNATLATLVGMSFSWKKGNGYYVSMPDNEAEIKMILAQFAPLFNSEKMIWIGQNIKYDLLILMNYGITLKGQYWDTMLAHYLFEPDGKRNMDALSAKYLNYQPVSIETLIGKKGKDQGNMRDVEVAIVKDYAAEDADITFQLKHCFQPLLEQENVQNIFHTIETPLLPVLAAMEFEGVGLDTDFLKNYSTALEKDIVTAEDAVYAAAGVRFNLASPKQLGEVLFDLLKIDPSAKKTKTGQYATGEDILEKLKNKHPIIHDILNFRELSKLKNTYADALPNLIHPRTGRIHTSFNQTIAVTGRLSSINPNLQNIPIRTERGREIRKAFISRNEDWVMLSSDYSQIELRIIAALSGDKNMIQAFQDGKDIHQATAAKVFGVAETEVDYDMRRKAKAVNFGIIYGQSAFGLAENLSIPRSEAKTIIENYFIQYPSIKKYMEGNILQAREEQFVKTILGRKRWLRDINSANATVRGFAERNAINMPIQGTAADMIKLAMIAVFKELNQEKLQTKMVLQVHDELVFDCPKNEVEQAKSLIKKAMENALILPNDVPVIAEAGTGKNWLEAH